MRGWRWGYLGGDVHYCVWIRSANLSKGGASTTNRCGSPRSEPTGTPPAGAAMVWTNQHGNNGLPATIDPGLRGCGGVTYRYANASPWLPVTSLTHPMGAALRRPHAVLKRYLTADRRVILVHEASLGHTGGYPSSWYFVPAACVRNRG